MDGIYCTIPKKVGAEQCLRRGHLFFLVHPGFLLLLYEFVHHEQRAE
jgi:hypothetical protein